MSTRIMEEVIESLNKSISEPGSKIEFSDENYEAIPISKENFYEIKNIFSKKKIAFVDGGNAEIISAPNFSLQFIRVYYVIYQNNKRIKSEKFEFYVLANAFSEKNKIKFKTKVFSDKKILEEENLVFDSQDKTLQTGGHRFSISKIGEIARRFAELKIASEINDVEFIVLDGDLQCSVTNEDIYLDKLFNNGLKNNILINAISKTSRLFTDSGNSFSNVIDHISPDSEWFYYPVAKIKNNSADICFLKLHKDSKHIFKLEFYQKQKFNPELVSLLKENSKDPIFLGYPYGLIETDKFARVSNKEKEYLQTIFIAKAGKKWKRIMQYTTNVNAHDILDKIS